MTARDRRADCECSSAESHQLKAGLQLLLLMPIDTGGSSRRFFFLGGGHRPPARRGLIKFAKPKYDQVDIYDMEGKIQFSGIHERWL